MNAKLTNDGRTVSVTIAENTPGERKLARTLACRTVGTVGIGAATITETKKGTKLTWTLSDAALASRKVVKATPSAAEIGARVKFIERDLLPHTAEGGTREAFLAREVARLTEALARVTGDYIPPVKAGKVNPFRRGPVTCETCADFGVVRKAGTNAGKAYRTKDGAAAATANGNSVKCPTHKRSKRTA